MKFAPFLKLCIATFLVFNGFMLVASFQFYVIIYYVFGGDKVLGAEYAGYAGTVSAIATFCVIFLITWIATHIGKRRAFFLSTGISIIGYGLKWFCYNPDYPLLLLLPAPLMAFGLGGLFTLMGSMIADVVDVDELETHQRREGMYGSIYWWVVKLGMAAALAASGFLLNATGIRRGSGRRPVKQHHLSHAGIRRQRPNVDIRARHLGRREFHHHGRKSPCRTPATGAAPRQALGGGRARIDAHHAVVRPLGNAPLSESRAPSAAEKTPPALPGGRWFGSP